MYPPKKKMPAEMYRFITVIFQKYLFVMKYLSLMSITFDIMGVLNEFMKFIDHNSLLFPFYFGVNIMHVTFVCSLHLHSVYMKGHAFNSI